MSRDYGALQTPIQGRVLRTKKRLPRVWYPLDKHIIGECSTRPLPQSRLWVKVLVFDGCGAMRRWWKKHLGHGIPNALAAVNSFGWTADDGRCTWVDERFCGVMVLNQRDLTLEIVAHECTHAAMAFNRRMARYGRQCSEKNDLPEEEIAYPIGKMVSEIWWWLEESGLPVRYNHHPKSLSPPNTRNADEQRPSH